MKRWFEDNLSLRKINKNLDYKIDINLNEKILVSSFQTEANNLAIKIKNFYSQKIYIGLSGGYDSEFICKTFLRNNIDFTPIIGFYPGNVIETKYAFNFCKKNNLNPIVIETTEKELLDIYFQIILKYYKGKGFRAPLNIICCNYVKSKDGLWIDGGTILGPTNYPFIKNHVYFYPDFGSSYCHDIFKNVPIIDFLNFTPEIFLSGLISVEDYYIDWRTFKSKVYDCEYRIKMKHELSDNFKNKVYEEWNKIKMPNPYCNFGTKQDILNKFNSNILIN